MPILRRRPVLRAAAIRGGAYDARRRRRETPQRPTSPAPGGMSDAALQRLEQLGRLREKGVLTDEEFAEQKAAVFGR